MKQTATPWAQGRALLTPQTQHWSSEAMERNDEVERRMVFTHFIERDLGRSRKLVAFFDNPDDAAFCVRACNGHDDLIDALYKALPFIEEAETDPHYKTGAAGKVVAQIRAALAKAGAA